MIAEQDLSCLFQSIDEHPEPVSAEMKGNLPSWLTGTLIRNGPGRFECGDTSFNHWFDGQGLLHRFHIEGGHVTYSNKFVRSESYADSLKHGSSNHYEFGSFIPPDPCQNIFTRFFSRFLGDELSMDNTLVNVFPMKEKIYATSERNCIFEINPETLDTLKKVNFTEFPGDTRIDSATAHPHQTPDGSVINVSVTHGRISTYNVIQIPPSTGKLDERPLEGGKVLCSFPPTSGVSYMHSFGLTENYVVVTETPLVLNVWQILTRRISESSFCDWLYWDANQLTRFHVIDRKQGRRLGIFTAEPFFTFHHINAFEEDGKIYLDACCYQDSSIVSQFYLHNMRSPTVPGEPKLDVADVRRYELPLVEEFGDVQAEKPLQKGADGLDYALLYSGLELPRFNYTEKNGKPYKFVYGVRDVKEIIFGQLVKLNVETKEFVTWQESGGFVSEPVFVKAPDGKDEDDGVVLSCVINIPDQTTSLLVLDAKDFKELGRAVVKGVTPMSLHGLFQKEIRQYCSNA